MQNTLLLLAFCAAAAIAFDFSFPKSQSTSDFNRGFNHGSFGNKGGQPEAPKVWSGNLDIVHNGMTGIQGGLERKLNNGNLIFGQGSAVVTNRGEVPLNSVFLGMKRPF